MIKKYQVIYADPPWRYDFSKKTADTIEVHYPTMSLEEICSLKIPSEDNSVLYLWATAPKLLEALEVIKNWGFIYKTHAIWDKGRVGIGYWFLGQHELLLVATKGKFSPPKDTERISSVIKENKTEHSKKPAYVRDMLSKWFPDKSKIEIFARPNTQLDLTGKNTFDGWDVFGNEVKSDITL